ncbi:F0F1 ATP synthase subunit epsilon [Rathayibacter toxicus]|uniref:ATP synthase F0F1 subunit epsilon n=1 Tax=Rathayibacter toxicus TaxID=145458 RepID=A0A0C5BAI4_9MICO|nr:F0F1 ATP synthase subunit epsilon [Rathayibacter toxicus]AJM77888.1 ATP synthase F0F1 subunit epsilon [Rathayibacter toxicus]ALS57919.1 ATP synthase F0F1 subunit epsilon [Rathayibacter toxicus]KKM46888.1 ATP synthase F0F1 subunit epsilon [Rathayibacter toxicus]PPG20402.1 F0F1 ATP synthase subunit epsilon [Rathayibacter toxicus]PPG45504.1 F0F1 ATP synthase subunit epsilon [Rathayibacter toxicus]
MAGTLKVSVVSANSEVWVGEAKQVTARTIEGEIGILVGHEPLLAMLVSGEVRVTAADGNRLSAWAEDGFLSVENDIVTVIAGEAALT